MKYRDPKKDSDLFSMIEHQQSVLKTVEGVNKLEDVIEWELFREMTADRLRAIGLPRVGQHKGLCNLIGCHAAGGSRCRAFSTESMSFGESLSRFLYGIDR